MCQNQNQNKKMSDCLPYGAVDATGSSIEHPRPKVKDYLIAVANGQTIYDFSIRRAHRWCLVGSSGTQRATDPRSVVDEHAVVFQYQEVTMVRAGILNERRTWGDWVGIGLGLLIGLTPLFAGIPENPARVLNSALVGVAVWGCP